MLLAFVMSYFRYTVWPSLLIKIILTCCYFTNYLKQEINSMQKITTNIKVVSCICRWRMTITTVVFVINQNKYSSSKFWSNYFTPKCCLNVDEIIKVDEIIRITDNDNRTKVKASLISIWLFHTSTSTWICIFQN